jgi:hypothetical protein
MRTRKNEIKVACIAIAVVCLFTILFCNNGNAQSPGKEVQLSSESYRNRYQNNGNSWTKWDTTKCHTMIAIFPEQGLIVVDNGNTDFLSADGQKNIYSINTKTAINQRWYSGVDYKGQPLIIKILKKGATYNVEFKYENKRNENGGLDVVGYSCEFLNCTVKTL